MLTTGRDWQGIFVCFDPHLYPTMIKKTERLVRIGIVLELTAFGDAKKFRRLMSEANLHELKDVSSPVMTGRLVAVLLLSVCQHR